jgi:ArsR family transcriptional regulator
MEESQAVRSLCALGHASRLQIFRLLARQGPEGLPAGKLAELLQLPAATLSFHLKELVNSNLIVDRRAGRSVIYSLNPHEMRSLMGFLLDDCCQGRPELCGPSSPATTYEITKND